LSEESSTVKCVAEMVTRCTVLQHVSSCVLHRGDERTHSLEDRDKAVDRDLIAVSSLRVEEVTCWL
jgi:hypothetical protein